jgi:hypothetical protein
MRGHRASAILGTMVSGWPMVLIGVVALLGGLAGVAGLLDRSGFSLYERNDRQHVPSPRQHRVLQRLGGGAMVVGGVAFVVVGVRAL